MNTTKYEKYYNMLQGTMEEISKNQDNWKAFLDTANRVYKYNFSEQALIFAQKPDATACANFNLWSDFDKMNRHIISGTEGIALIGKEKNKLCYVFDISDTVERNHNSKTPKLWQINDENKDVIAEKLNKKYGTTEVDLAKILDRISHKFAQDNFGKYIHQPRLTV